MKEGGGAAFFSYEEKGFFSDFKSKESKRDPWGKHALQTLRPSLIHGMPAYLKDSPKTFNNSSGTGKYWLTGIHQKQS